MKIENHRPGVNIQVADRPFTFTPQEEAHLREYSEGTLNAIEIKGPGWRTLVMKNTMASFKICQDALRIAHST